MPYPVAIVEIAFDDGPYVVSPTWTDVTAYVRDMEISRGVNDDWDLVAAGSASVTLSNRDRRFDPFNTSGPYYGKLLPRRQIRITAVADTFYTVDVFRGFVNGWPPTWTDAGYDSTVTLSCFDALQLLGSSSLPADWSRPYILSLNPRHYYPCDEPINSYDATQVIKDYGSFPLNMTGGAGVVSGQEVAEGLSSNSLGTIGTAATTISSPAIAATNFTVSFWAFMGEGNVGGNIGVTDWAIGYLATVDTLAVVIGDSGTYRTWTCTTDLSLSAPHFYAFTYNATSKGMDLYVDGVLVSTTLTTTATANATRERVYVTNGVYQQVCLWTSILTQTQLQNIFNWSSARFPETTSARFNRIIGETPFSASLTSVPASPASSLLGITNDAPTANSELGKVADSEYAPLFVSKAGVITLYQQSQIRTQVASITSQASYGRTALTSFIPIGPEVSIQYDGDSMRNVANVEMSGGGVYIQDNPTSVTAYGEAEQSVPTQVASLADAVDIAHIVSGWGGQVYPKVEPIEVVLSPNQSWFATLNLELFDRIDITIQPPEYSPISNYYLLTRVTHSVSPERWTTTLEGSARWAAVFILNSSRLGGTDLLG